MTGTCSTRRWKQTISLPLTPLTFDSSERIRTWLFGIEQIINAIDVHNSWTCLRYSSDLCARTIRLGGESRIKSSFCLHIQSQSQIRFNGVYFLIWKVLQIRLYTTSDINVMNFATSNKYYKYTSILVLIIVYFIYIRFYIYIISILISPEKYKVWVVWLQIYN